VLITVNGRARALPGPVTVADAAATVGVAPGDRGVAAALDGAVVPRAEWTTTPVPAGAAVEVVRAAAGG
jgi:sulfur carrier protein